MDKSATSNQVQGAPGSDKGKLNAADGNKFEQWKSTASATAKLLLCGIKESADAFPPLKSVVGGLCFILDNCEVWKTLQYMLVTTLMGTQQTSANNQAMKSLAPRVVPLFGTLCRPVPEGDVKEKIRRNELQR